MSVSFFFFFFNDTATTEIYTLSLHDALPIYESPDKISEDYCHKPLERHRGVTVSLLDRKSTRLNSSHLGISYAVFCLKKKKKKLTTSNSHNIRKTRSFLKLASIADNHASTHS